MRLLWSYHFTAIISLVICSNSMHQEEYKRFMRRISVQREHTHTQTHQHAHSQTHVSTTHIIMQIHTQTHASTHTRTHTHCFPKRDGWASSIPTEEGKPHTITITFTFFVCVCVVLSLLLYNTSKKNITLSEINRRIIPQIRFWKADTHTHKSLAAS